MCLLPWSHALVIVRSEREALLAIQAEAEAAEVGMHAKGADSENVRDVDWNPDVRVSGSVPLCPIAVPWCCRLCLNTVLVHPLLARAGAAEEAQGRGRARDH
jgi:hypothetical protein